MSIPIAIFYFIYLGFVGAFILFSLFNVFELVRYGVGVIKNAIAAFYILMTIVILMISWQFNSKIDWNQQIPLQLQVIPGQSLEKLEI